MKTHTVRTSKARTARIVTFTPAFEQELLAVHPWARDVLIATLLKDIGASLDHDQRERMQAAAAPVPDRSYHQSRALSWLQSGFRLLDNPLEEALAILDLAARALYTALPEASRHQA